MAGAGLGVLGDHGLAVPDDVSIVVWDDTALSRLTPPGLSVVAVDVHALGVAVADAVLAVLGRRARHELRVAVARGALPRVDRTGPDGTGMTSLPGRPNTSCADTELLDRTDLR